MSARRTLAIARRIVDGFRHDRRSLALVFVVPLLVLGLLGWVIRGESTPTTRLGVLDGAGPVGGRVVAAITTAARTAGISVVDVGPDEATARQALRDGRADVVLVIPATFAGEVSAGTVRLTVVTPGLSPTDDASRIAALQRAMFGVLSGRAAAGGPAIDFEHQTIFGSPNADLLDAFAPALIGFFGFFLVFILTGVSFLRERVGGTLERLLATPVRRAEIVAGYSLGFGLFAALQVTVILAFSLGAVQVPAIGPLPAFTVGLGIADAGAPVLVFGVVLLLAIGAVNLAIFLSTFAHTELQVVQFIPVVIVPQTLLGGIFWPVSSLPGPLRVLAQAMPLTYAVDGLREVLVRGSGLGSGALQLDLVVLAGVAVGFVLLAAGTIRREVA